MRAKPRLGQHFLKDQEVLRRIAATAAGPADTVVEIGPGRGALTRHLVQTAARVVAVEIDAELACMLGERCGSPRNLEVVHADILRVDASTYTRESNANQSVIAGNLPYYITSPILRSVFTARKSFRTATFLMQEEVADRAVARRGGGSYCYLSCWCQLHSRPAKLFTVPPEAFSPAPRVRSAVVQFDLAKDDPPDGLQDFVGACFQAPRKTLRNNLSGRYPKALLGADPSSGLRAEQLTLDELAEMWRRLEGRR